MLSLSVVRRLAVMLALVLVCVSTATQARTRATRAEIGTVVAIDRNLQDRPNSWYAPGKATGAIIGGVVGRLVGRNSSYRNEAAAVGAALGTATGSAYDRREVKGWMTVVRYADGSVDEVETARQPDVRVGDAVYISSNGALVRAPTYVNGDARPQVTFASDSGGSRDARNSHDVRTSRNTRDSDDSRYRVRYADEYRNDREW